MLEKGRGKTERMISSLKKSGKKRKEESGGGRLDTKGGRNFGATLRLYSSLYSYSTNPLHSISSFHIKIPFAPLGIIYRF